jgi:catechol 2,3-dioxygenase-like lactoylglutathione lyase family enzyme
MVVQSLDHLVLTFADIPLAIDFYTRVLGMRHETFGERRHAVVFGDQKINLHVLGEEFEPKAAKGQMDSADLSFLTTSPIDHVVAHLQSENVPIELGLIRRTGATGPILSVYVRDPGGNLIELANASA